MRIVIDMQGAQTESRFRGIGRYTLSLAQAIARNRGEHEVLLALSGLFPHTIEPLRAAFDGILPQHNIHVWQAPGPVCEMNPANAWRREAAELIRESFLASLEPDVIHVCSFFEGYIDDAVTSLGLLDQQTPVSVTLHDLIPLLNPEHYLKHNPGYEAYYLRKATQLKSASIYLAVSNSSLQEGKTHLGATDERLFNTSEAVEPHFRPLELGDEVRARLQAKFGFSRPFVLYTGGADDRKNLARLIEAHAALPPTLRQTCQLLFAGKISQGEVLQLQHQARAVGLDADELVFTGYVSDAELIELYNLCRLFVFPSWHEGFGLPALEAMACGAAVIAANTSSLPEVVGLDEALFDPLDVAAMSRKIAAALGDEAFRQRLRAHGLDQARNFSWDESARRAIAAFETHLAAQRASVPPDPAKRADARRPRLAYVSPLPPERTGIADYSADLLPALARHYDIEAVVVQVGVKSAWVEAHCPIRDPQWLREHAAEFDRVVYQFGNSPFHSHMLALLQEVPGVVVLHDFHLGSLHAWMESHSGEPHFWSAALYASHGYGALRERFRNGDAAADAVKMKYPVNLDIVQQAHGVIVHSEHARSLARRWYGPVWPSQWQVIPLVRTLVAAPRREAAAARARLGLAADEFITCSFGFIDSSKLNHRLLDAWLESRLASDPHCRLVFVGENHPGAYGAGLLERIRRAGLEKRIVVTGYVAPERFKDYLMAADLAVQLRTSSRGETSAAVLDCLNHALPTIVNAHGSMAELDEDSVWMLPDEFPDSALAAALETLWTDAERRERLGRRGREIIAARHAPEACARRYAEAIEAFQHRSTAGVPALARGIVALAGPSPTEPLLSQLAQTISLSLPPRRPLRRLLLDISATCRNDLKTGIERVARALLLALLDAPPVGYRVEPVYLCDEDDASAGGVAYRLAARYTLRLLDCPDDVLVDEIVEPENGDILLTLDLAGERLVEAQRAGLHALYRNMGVKVVALVHDLLPVRQPEVFPPRADRGHADWLSAIAEFDGAICVSAAVADELAAWREARPEQGGPRRPYRIAWSHHGADVAHTAPTRGMPADAAATLEHFAARPTFLLVGTIEPRKGYLQTLDAFNLLWQAGIDVNLAIVGAEGWKSLPDAQRRTIPETIARLRLHPERNQRLFWLEGISDEYLEKVYAASSALIAASTGEGFGLPLIEAAQHGLPIVARDLPVFREVAGDHASYFSAVDAAGLAGFLRGWLEQYRTGTHVRADALPWLTWRQSAAHLQDALAEIGALPIRAG